MSYRVLTIVPLMLSTCFLSVVEAEWTVSSPDSMIRVNVFEDGTNIAYQVDLGGAPLITPSAVLLELMPLTEQDSFNPDWSINSDQVSINSVDESWKPVFGKRSTVSNRYNELVLPFVSKQQNGLTLTVIFRVYDDGLAFRQKIGLTHDEPEGELGFLIKASTSTITLKEDISWWSYRVERPPIRGEDVMQYPIYGETPSGRTIVITEGHLRDIAPMKLARINDTLEIQSSPNIEISGGSYAMPWRVIMVGDTAGELIDSDLIVNLNPKADPSDFEWLQPGVVLWDWRAFGYEEKDGFVYGQNRETWTRYIDFAAETGIPYIILDANWYGPEHSEDSDPINGGLAEDVRELIKYGETKGVGLILYLNHVGAMRDGIEDIMKTYQSWGAKGIKYGFMKVKGAEQTKLVHEISRLAEKHQLMINFHDGPLPPTGEEAYLPGMVNREFCHAQSDAKRSFLPSDFIGMAHVNMVAGPLDMNNGMFDLDNSANMRPRVFSQINSTLTAEAARTLITYGGGWTVIPDAPGSYREHMELFRFISEQKLPWNESKTLSSKMGEHISMVRQTGDIYLVGSVTNEEARTFDIDLSFLPKGRQYMATVFSDTDSTHYINDRLAYKIEQRTVDAGSVIKAKLAPGGGHCMIIEPVK